MWIESTVSAELARVKMERGHGYGSHSRHAKDKTLAWILWDNQSSLHSTLNYVSLMQFERGQLPDQIKQACSCPLLWDLEFEGKVKLTKR